MKQEFFEKRVLLPEGFSASVEGKTLSVSGSGKNAERHFKAKGILLACEGKEIVVRAEPSSRKMNALASTVASHVKNMCSGIRTEYVYSLLVVFSHFPMNVSVKGAVVEINNFVGEKKARAARIMPGASVSIKGKEIVVKSHNKEAAGQTAANLERATKVRGKDTRIYQDGIFIVSKGAK